MEYYLIFVVATSIVSLIWIFSPVVNAIRTNFPESPTAQSPYAAYVSLILLAVITAPIMFLMIMVPSYTARFKESLYNEMVSKIQE